jgi:hypothetical protein
MGLRLNQNLESIIIEINMKFREAIVLPEIFHKFQLFSVFSKKFKSG